MEVGDDPRHRRANYRLIERRQQQRQHQTAHDRYEPTPRKNGRLR